VKLKLATTHPIQYQVPWFRALAARPELDLEVGYAVLPDDAAQGAGFGVAFAWDIPLLDGYRWRLLDRNVRNGGGPDLESFGGLRLRHPGRWLGHDTTALLVTGWNSLALVQLAFAARRRRIPVLVRGDSNLRRPRRLATRLLHRLFLRLYAAFLVVGEANRAFYRSYGMAEDRLFDCPHFVDNERFSAAAAAAWPSRREHRRRWALGEQAVVVCFAGKLIPTKNIPELLTALALARRTRPELELLVVGDGELRPELEASAHELGVPTAWAGFLNQSELPQAYASADLLVLPSLGETWGLVVNEALACGLPVIASDRVGCVPDLVLPGRTGETYRSGQPQELAERLARLAANTELRATLGAAGRRLVSTRYSVTRAVDGTLAALTHVARAA
jgi:glycosyltransferase involved in cell wall biosynthesis